MFVKLSITYSMLGTEDKAVYKTDLVAALGQPKLSWGRQVSNKECTKGVYDRDTKL